MDDVMMTHLLRVANEIKAAGKPYSQQVFFNECGTPSCIAGYCAVDPAFIRAGLRHRNFRAVLDELDAHGLHACEIPVFGPMGNEHMGVSAMAALLDLNENAACYIFGTEQEIADLLHSDFSDQFNDIDNTIRRIQRVINGEFGD